MLTAYAFGSINQTLGLRGALGLFAGVMVLVAVSACFIPETKGLTLEQIEMGVVFGDDVDGNVTSSSESVGKPDQKVFDGDARVHSTAESV